MPSWPRRGPDIITATTSNFQMARRRPAVSTAEMSRIRGFRRRRGGGAGTPFSGMHVMVILELARAHCLVAASCVLRPPPTATRAPRSSRSMARLMPTTGTVRCGDGTCVTREARAGMRPTKSAVPLQICVHRHQSGSNSRYGTLL